MLTETTQTLKITDSKELADAMEPVTKAIRETLEGWASDEMDGDFSPWEQDFVDDCEGIIEEETSSILVAYGECGDSKTAWDSAYKRIYKAAEEYQQKLVDDGRVYAEDSREHRTY